VTSINRLMNGAVDLHCHSAPSPFPRRFDHVGAAEEAEGAGFRAILVKSHHHSTVMDVLAMAPRLAEVSTEVYGGVALNSQVGGINPYAVEMALRLGGRAVWFPTFSSRRHIESHPESDGFPTSTIHLTSAPVDVTDANGRLLPEVYDVLDRIAEADALLSAGHMFPDDILKVFSAAHERGVRRMVISHPDFVINASVELCRELVDMGAFVEHEFGMYDPEGYRKWDPRQLAEWIDAIGPDRTILASDLGQAGRPSPVDALGRVLGRLVDLGVPEDSLEPTIKQNPAFLLGLEEVPLAHAGPVAGDRADGD
jgi:hypothetical protein